MDVYAVDVRQMDPPFGVREVWGVARLDDLLAVSDWFVVTAAADRRDPGHDRPTGNRAAETGRPCDRVVPRRNHR